MQISEIKQLFGQEFGEISRKFVILDLGVSEAEKSNADYVYHPGVYVWWHPQHGVLKVGRHLTNSRKRALEHVAADTGGRMKSLADDPETRILLFNVIEQSHRHWVAALEVFFEKALSPAIRSARLG